MPVVKNNDPLNYQHRGIYGCYNNGKLMYVGSTTLGLVKLEANHREARSKGYSMSKFRSALEEEGANWNFKWLIKPFTCQQTHIEFAESILIQAMQPDLNVDTDPYASSVRYGRYGDLLEVL